MKTSFCLIAIIYFAFPSAFSQQIQYKNNSFSLTNLSPPTQAAGAKKSAYWDLFWEFGDGNYSKSNLPNYCYEKNGTYTVRVSMTPHYSHSPSKSITQTITVNSGGNCRNIGDDTQMRNHVLIESDAANELVPDNEIQVILQYKMPATANQGYLVFLYNSDQEKRAARLNFSPLRYKDTPRLHGAKKMTAVQPMSMNIREQAKIYLNEQLNVEKYSAVGFECAAQPNEVKRIFLTLAASQALDTLILKKKKDELITSIKAVFIPKDRAFEVDKMTDTYRLKMLSVHDPNKMEVSPRRDPLFNKKFPQQLTYTVHFQNKGGKAADQVNIRIPWNQNLDANSIQVIDREPKKTSYCLDCKDIPNFDPEVNSESCFKKDISKVESEGMVYFTFYNVQIHGKQEEGIGGGKYTKGLVTFEVNSTSDMVDKTAKNALIEFKGGEEFETNKVYKRWKHQGLGVKIGRNIGGSSLGEIRGEESVTAGFDRLNDNFTQWYNVGIYQRRNYVRNGFTLFAGWEASVAGFGFEHKNSNLVALDDIVTEGFGSRVVMEEEIRLHTLDLQAQTEYRVGGFLAVGAGGGLSIPLSGKGNIRANAFELNDFANFLDDQRAFDLWFDDSFFREEFFEDAFLIENGFRENLTSSFGLFNDRSNQDAILFNQDVASSMTVGGIAHWFVEAGLLNNVALGFRQDFRIYPNSYKNQCLKFNNFELYLRIKLASKKPF